MPTEENKGTFWVVKYAAIDICNLKRLHEQTFSFLSSISLGVELLGCMITSMFTFLRSEIYNMISVMVTRCMHLSELTKPYT